MFDAAPKTWENQTDSKLILVPQHLVLGIFDQVGPMLQKALDRADGKFNLYDLIAWTLAGNMHLWVSMRDGKIEAACIAQILRFPRKTICGLPFLGGKGMAHWLRFENQMMEWAKSQGATEFEGYDARAGAWLRKLTDWSLKYTVIGKKI